MSADAGGVCTFDDYVPGEVGDFTSVIAASAVFVFKRAIQSESSTFQFGDPPRFGGNRFGIIPGHPVLMDRAVRSGDNHLIAHTPTRHSFGQRDGLISGFGIISQIHPGPVHGCSVEIHSSGTTGDGWCIVLVHPFKIMEADFRGVLGRNGVI